MDLTSKDSLLHYAFSYPALPFSQDNLLKSEDKIQTIAYGCTLKSKKSYIMILFTDYKTSHVMTDVTIVDILK